MSRSHRYWKPPLPGVPSHRGPSMSESVSDAEKAGEPLPPYVELRPGGPPVELVEAGPNPPEPPPPPFDRAAALARIPSAFAALTDGELQVGRLRMLGVPYIDIADELWLTEEEVVKIWKQARRKLGAGMFGAPAAGASPPAPSTSAPPEAPHPADGPAA